MDASKYLIFDIVCDYVKGKKNCANFRLICSELKIISADLFRLYYSAYLLNNTLINIGFDTYFTVDDIKDLGYDEILKLIIIDCNYPYMNYQVIYYRDPLDPTKNTKKNRFKIRGRILRQNSLLFSMALHYAEKPRYIEQNKERYIP